MYEILSNIKENKESMKQKIDNALQVLSEKEREVITLRNIQVRDKSWDYIAMKSDLSEAWVRVLKKKAIKKMAPIVFPIENNDKIAL
ncbi:hypothetical protein JHL18_23565 [Clostridium sp. YIM B02505]|uniref:RNA polymerase sigma-70 region 4 domain-containing protein n=1 Tax=Clostridium yunnanense TaxID=2800325 RepID=A0ABS1EW39_9CLOT|nr:sigma factor-like helix-turn-helix DNA-binding protein [Clostridium yunnanense]MBK1813600.1 hypothetical protein [Clostridium yunnanense]